VAQATEGRDPIVVLGALLHDTIEDTRTTADELEGEFGADGCRGVNPWLEGIFDRTHRDGLARLAADE